VEVKGLHPANVSSKWFQDSCVSKIK